MIANSQQSEPFRDAQDLAGFIHASVACTLRSAKIASEKLYGPTPDEPVPNGSCTSGLIPTLKDIKTLMIALENEVARLDRGLREDVKPISGGAGCATISGGAGCANAVPSRY